MRTGREGVKGRSERKEWGERRGMGKTSEEEERRGEKGDRIKEGKERMGGGRESRKGKGMSEERKGRIGEKGGELKINCSY